MLMFSLDSIHFKSPFCFISRYTLLIFMSILACAGVQRSFFYSFVFTFPLFQLDVPTYLFFRPLIERRTVWIVATASTFDCSEYSTSITIKHAGFLVCFLLNDRFFLPTFIFFLLIVVLQHVSCHRLIFLFFDECRLNTAFVVLLPQPFVKTFHSIVLI